MTAQLSIDFNVHQVENGPVFPNSRTGRQRKALYEHLNKGHIVTGNDHEKFGIAASALPRRIKDLVDYHNIPVHFDKKMVVCGDGGTVRISTYQLERFVKPKIYTTE